MKSEPELPVPPWRYRSPLGRVEADPLRETARLRKEWAATLDGMPLRFPNRSRGAVPIPGATRGPRPPWVPKPPPHLDPDRTEEEREAAYRIVFNEWRAAAPHRAHLPDDHPDLIHDRIGRDS